MIDINDITVMADTGHMVAWERRAMDVGDGLLTPKRKVVETLGFQLVTYLFRKLVAKPFKGKVFIDCEIPCGPFPMCTGRHQRVAKYPRPFSEKRYRFIIVVRGMHWPLVICPFDESTDEPRRRLDHANVVIFILKIPFILCNNNHL